MGRRRKKDPKRNGLYLRLTDRQLELLQRYVDYKDYESEVDALRKMIDGLEDWFSKRSRAQGSIAGSSSTASAIAGSPQPPPVTSKRASSDAPASDVADSKEDLGESSTEGSVGDFGGRLNVGLPEPHWSDGNGD